MIINLSSITDNNAHATLVRAGHKEYCFIGCHRPDRNLLGSPLHQSLGNVLQYRAWLWSEIQSENPGIHSALRKSVLKRRGFDDWDLDDYGPDARPDCGCESCDGSCESCSAVHRQQREYDAYMESLDAERYGPSDDFGPDDFGPDDFGPDDFGPDDFGPDDIPF